MNHARGTITSRQQVWLGGLALVSLTLVVFWPVLTFDFVRWDDDINVTQNPLLTTPWSGELLRQIFASDQALRFKPLHWLLFRGLHALFGFEPAGWHAFNLGLHAVAALLLYGVLRQIFALRGLGGRSGAGDWAALLGAGLWALHPLRAEAVAWVTASTYPLAATLLLGSFACYVAAYRRRRLSWLGWSWVLALAAYASYPVAATYGLWLVAADCWLLPAGREKDRWWTPGFDRRWLFKQLAFLLPAGVAVGLTVWARFASPGIFTAAPTMESVDLFSRLAMALAGLAYCVWRLVWPVGLTPNVPPMGHGDSDQLWAVLWAGLVLIGLVALWRARRRAPGLALIGLGAAALALPCLGWTERPAWPVDRYSYVVHLVLVGGLAGGLLWATAARRRWRMVLGFTAAGLLVAEGLAGRRQIMIWQDSPALFTHMEQHPHFADNPRQQGHIYILWADYEAAAAHPARAAELFNRAQEVYLAAIRSAVGRADFPEALALVTHLEHFFTLSPVMHREKGAWLLRLDRPIEAGKELQAAARMLPDDPRTKTLLQDAAQRLGR